MTHIHAYMHDASIYNYWVLRNCCRSTFFGCWRSCLVFLSSCAAVCAGMCAARKGFARKGFIATSL